MAEDPSQEPVAAVSKRLVGAGLVIGAWAVLPPFVGPSPNTPLSVELIDHPLPALVVLGVVAWAARSGEAAEKWLFAGGLAITLAGVWMTATHVPLVLQALDGLATWPATVSHSLPTLAVLVLGLLWTWRYR